MRGKVEEPVEFVVEVVHETAKALLCRFEEADDAEVWVPKSVVVEKGTEVAEVGDTGMLVVQAWWARKQELT